MKSVYRSVFEFSGRDLSRPYVKRCLCRDAIMQFKKTIRITPHPQPLSHASGERGEKTLLLAPLPEFGEGREWGRYSAFIS